MKNTIGALVIVATSSWLSMALAEGVCTNCPSCHSGCRHGCPDHECVRVPSHKTIKKTVYDVKCVPICEHRPAKFLAGCDCCPVCQLKYKKVLIKREIVVCEVCTTNCVPVEISPGCCPVGSGKVASDRPAAYAEPPLPPPTQVTIEP